MSHLINLLPKYNTSLNKWIILIQNLFYSIMATIMLVCKSSSSAFQLHVYEMYFVYFVCFLHSHPPV